VSLILDLIPPSLELNTRCDRIRLRVVTVDNGRKLLQQKENNFNNTKKRVEPVTTDVQLKDKSSTKSRKESSQISINVKKKTILE